MDKNEIISIVASFSGRRPPPPPVKKTRLSPLTTMFKNLGDENEKN